jgi:hypothetical protein
LNEYFVERRENFLEPDNPCGLLKEEPEQIAAFFLPAQFKSIGSLVLF